MSDAKLLHRTIRRLAKWAVWSFFTELHVIGSENVPKDGPIIVYASLHLHPVSPYVSPTIPCHFLVWMAS